MTTAPQASVARWPEPGWTPIQPFPFSAAREAFAGMTSDEQKVLLRYYRRPDGSLVATAAFGPRAEGAPGIVHGGAILTALDEALGAVGWVAGRPVLTARLTTDFRKGMPTLSSGLIETRLVGERHRLLEITGELRGADGTLYASAVGRYIELADETHRKIFGRGA